MKFSKWVCIFCLIVFSLACVNFLLGSEFRYLLGSLPYTFTTAFLATCFFLLFRRDPVDLMVTMLAYCLLLLPVYFLTEFGVRDCNNLEQFAITVSQSNCWALLIAMLTMIVTASSAFISFVWGRYAVLIVSALLWFSIILLSLAFAGYWVLYRSVLSPEILVAVWQTNPQEVFEYISSQGEMFAICLVAIAFGLLAVFTWIMVHRQTINLN